MATAPIAFQYTPHIDYRTYNDGCKVSSTEEKDADLMQYTCYDVAEPDNCVSVIRLT